jgi:molybdopterin converting factor small subunit
MEIRLQRYLGLGGYSTDSHTESIALILPEKSSINELLQMQGIPVGDVGMVVVNGTLSRKDSTLKEGDCVQLYPWLEGG